MTKSEEAGATPPPWAMPAAEPVFLKEKIKSAAQSLFEQIAAGAYSYGARLPAERQLAEELSLTRDAIRQVIEFLESYDVVKRRANSGTFVTYRPNPSAAKEIAERASGHGLLDVHAIVDNASPFELTIVRSIIEPELVRLAAMYMSASDLRRLSQLIERMQALVTEAPAFADLERAYMNTLAAGTRNPILIAMYNVIDAVKGQAEWQRNRIQSLTPSRILDSKNKLQSLHEALVARDIETSVEFMKLIVADENDAMISRN